MQILNSNKIKEVNGAFSCNYINSPTNWASVGGLAFTTAALGGGPAGAFIVGGMDYVLQHWNCHS